MSFALLLPLLDEASDELLLEDGSHLYLEATRTIAGSTPARYAALVLQDQMESNGYGVFYNHMPDKPDKAICVYDLPYGRVEDRRMRTGVHEEHPVVQIIVRGPDYTAVSALEGAWAVFETLYEYAFDDGKILRCISKNNTIATLGQEPQTRRCLFSQQFRMTLE